MDILSEESQVQNLPELEDVFLDDDGGTINLLGIEYQFHFAAKKCLEMICEPDQYEFVSSETHEDVVIKLKSGSYEFYQVKVKGRGEWSLSDIRARGIWSKFLSVRAKFGPSNSFWFVSDQTARFSKQHGNKRIPDLGKMKELTWKGISICQQDENDKVAVATLIERLAIECNLSDRLDAESFFWNIRILTDYERTRGLLHLNINTIHKILEMRSISVDETNARRIYASIISMLRDRVNIPPEADYEETINRRKILIKDVNECFAGPFTSPKLTSFYIDEEFQPRTLREKTEKLGARWTDFFIESRIYFVSRFQNDRIFAEAYIAELRHKVWAVCNRQNLIRLTRGYEPLQSYEEIQAGLDKLAADEQKKDPPIDVDSNYLHGMMCQLSAECYHDWYLME